MKVNCSNSSSIIIIGTYYTNILNILLFKVYNINILITLTELSLKLKTDLQLP
jgi:hypothetical protein